MGEVYTPDGTQIVEKNVVVNTKTIPMDI